MISRLGPADRTELLRLLSADPVQNVYLIGLVEAGTPRGELVGFREGAALKAVLLLGSNVVLYASGQPGEPGWQGAVEALARFATSRELAGRIIVGERRLVDTFHAIYQKGGRPARWSHGQIVFEADDGDIARFPDPKLRRARLAELDAIVEAEARLVHHELGIDPHERDLASFSARVAERVARGHVFAHFSPGGQVLFKADISCRTQRVIQIGGVYTAPEARRSGLAKRGLSEMCYRLFSEEQPPPHLMLYVNDFNHAALGLYRTLGFRQTFNYRSVFIEE